jgi:hypothetical protein
MYLFYTIGSFVEFRTDGWTIPMSDRNGVPIEIFGKSEKMGIPIGRCN